MPIYKNLALEGGGTKGHIYLGCGEELERLGILDDLDAIAGASVGAVAATLFATGWSMKKIKEKYNQMDFEGMALGGCLAKLFIPHNLNTKFGAFTGEAYHQWLKAILKEATKSEKYPEGKENITFEEWHELKEMYPELKLKDLFVEACNMETEYNETFSYRSEHKDVPIADAVFASMKFPGFFSMFEIKGTLYADGGLQRNCPSRVFEDEDENFNPETLSIRLDHQNEINYFEKGIKPPRKRPKTLLQALGAIFGAATKSQDYDFFSSPYKNTTIFVSTLDVGTLDFDLSVDKQKALMASGQYGTLRYFHQKHPELTKKAYQDDKALLALLEKNNFPLTITDFMQIMAANDAHAVAAPAVIPMLSSWQQLPDFKDIKPKPKEAEVIPLRRQSERLMKKKAI